MKEDEDVNEKKAHYFFKNDIPVHINFKNGYWKRGFIKEMSSDFFTLDEFLEGMMPVFFLEIKEIQSFKKPGEMRDDGTK